MVYFIKIIISLVKIEINFLAVDAMMKIIIDFIGIVIKAIVKMENTSLDYLIKNFMYFIIIMKAIRTTVD